MVAAWLAGLGGSLLQKAFFFFFVPPPFCPCSLAEWLETRPLLLLYKCAHWPLLHPDTEGWPAGDQTTSNYSLLLIHL